MAAWVLATTWALGLVKAQERYLDAFPSGAGDAGVMSSVVAELKGFVEAARGLPDKITDSSIGMAVAIRDKIQDYGELLTGKGAPEDDGDSENTSVMITHLAALDALRASKPELYGKLVQMSKDGTTVASAAQMVELGKTL